jgi:hypothetical protein
MTPMTPLSTRRDFHTARTVKHPAPPLHPRSPAHTLPRNATITIADSATDTGTWQRDNGDRTAGNPDQPCVAARRGLVKAPRAGSDGRTNPLHHRLLYTDSRSWAATHTRTAGTDRVLSTRAEPHISERRFADATMVTWGACSCTQGHGATVSDGAL